MGRHVAPALPAPVLTVAHGAATDVGRVRTHNEDAYLAHSPVFLVADGMGGHRAGDVASTLCLNAFAPLRGRDFVSAPELSGALTQAARDVAGLGADGGAPGTTLSGLVLSTQGDLPCIRIVNIGDSRTYHFGAGTFSLVTHDHSEVQELIDAGKLTEEQARTSGRRNVITRALGAGGGPEAAADHFVLPAHARDRFVICSDGLSGQVTSALIEIVVRSVGDPAEAAHELVRRALASGGHDNVTVVVVDVLEARPQWGRTAVDETTIPRHLEDTALEDLEDTVPRPNPVERSTARAPDESTRLLHRGWSR